MKRKATAIIIAWILFIGVDFLFHAGLFASLWKEEIATFKSLEELALLIPVGYLSFLFLTILVGFVFFKIFKNKPLITEVLTFSITFGMLYALSNALGNYSYIEIPIKQLLLFNLIYFLEIMAVGLALYYVMYTERLKKVIWRSILIFFGLVIAGIAIQNIMG